MKMGAEALPIPFSRDAASALAAELVTEMTRRWRQGERPIAEEFLARHADLWHHPEAAADLIYEELCLRQEFGTPVALDEILARFPQWRLQLEVLFDCQRLLTARIAPAARQFPAAGETLGDFLLLAEIGRGAQGPVFLASQLSLGDRPVVLKLTPCDADEHLSLARLQHTNIVPLYSVQDHPARGLRALCMPYFGGATMAQLLDALRSQPFARRTGQSLLDALDRLQATAPPVASARRVPANPARAKPWVSHANSYARAIAWIGACLTDALQYAHERGVVHLDLKPSNVLVAADGQPMVLDFHLAREPIRPDAGWPQWFGGTTGYMSPEQEAAVRAAQQGRPVPAAVDGRSDIYSLGVILYEALGGILPPVGPAKGAGSRRSRSARGTYFSLRNNPQVSPGLADIVAKSLADDPDDRYPHMAALAADLRRHLADLPLAGVRNRSLTERWLKWRRRRPHGVALVGMMLAVVTAAGAVALGFMSHARARIEQAQIALNDAQVQMAAGHWDDAVQTLRRGLEVARGLPLQSQLADELDRRLRLAEHGRDAASRAAAARELHRLADRVRFLYGADTYPPESLRDLADSCGAVWASRAAILDRLSAHSGAGLGEAGGASPEVRAGPGSISPATEDVNLREDLLDLAIFRADVIARTAPPDQHTATRGQVVALLNEAEAQFGPSPVLDAERRLHGVHQPPALAGGPNTHPDEDATAWPHYALARALLRSGDLDRAAAEADRAVQLEPHDLWPNFYQGLCAYRRGHHLDAVAAFSICIGAAPDAAGGYYNRALAFSALGQSDQARPDFDQAQRLDPTLRRP
jgi:serine/threonine protein kinase/tetratricopeptide (TPR) repeat protein